MIKVNVKKQSSYPIKATVLKNELKKFLEKRGLVSDFTVNVSVVGRKAMSDMSKKFLGENNSLHTVLSFPESEMRGDFEYPPKTDLSLGEIVICYPEVVEEAKEEGKLLEPKIIELIKHGAKHLLGEHHE
jgi:probable rRNA maturation factor